MSSKFAAHLNYSQQNGTFLSIVLVLSILNYLFYSMPATFHVADILVASTTTKKTPEATKQH